MAYRDGTGPMGAGPMTGRGFGFCSGVVDENSMNFITSEKRIFGCRRGRGGAGAGRGFRNFNGNGRQRLAGMQNFENSYGIQKADTEKNYLKSEAEFLKQSLEAVTKRLEKLESEKADK
ncbi:DUF5320 domain-containing protein [Candidatus Dependentiae bacterium]|nr:DUF5320 domain-containing protein [Candidatus Dependentiae bacterium]